VQRFSGDWSPGIFGCLGGKTATRTDGQEISPGYEHRILVARQTLEALTLAAPHWLRAEGLRRKVKRVGLRGLRRNCRWNQENCC
jgi:hypothetical protein